MENDLKETVRALRRALGDTQQEFADRLKLAKPTVVRYESSRTPKGKALAQLAHVAKAHGFDNYADVFRTALAEENAGEVQPKIEFFSDRERRLVLGVLAALRNEEYAEIANDVERCLEKPVKRCSEILTGHRFTRGVSRAALRLLDEGRNSDDVAEMLGLTPEEATNLAQSRALMRIAKQVGLVK